MDRQIRGQLPRQPGKAHVLHDQRIHPRSLGSQQKIGRLLKLRREDQHVHGEESLHTAAVEPIHHRRQIGGAEVFGPQASIELLHPEVHGVSAVGYGRLQRLPAAGGSQQLRQTHHQRLSRWAASKVLRASAEPSKRQCQGS